MKTLTESTAQLEPENTDIVYQSTRREAMSAEYIDELVAGAVKNCKHPQTSDPLLSAGYDQPKKDVVVAQHKSRFAAQRIDDQVQLIQEWLSFTL